MKNKKRKISLIFALIFSCFEYNDIIIWGANSQYGNISIKNSRNVDYHRGGYIVPSTQAGVMNLITTATP